MRERKRDRGRPGCSCNFTDASRVAVDDEENAAHRKLDVALWESLGKVCLYVAGAHRPSCPSSLCPLLRRTLNCFPCSTATVPFNSKGSCPQFGAIQSWLRERKKAKCIQVERKDNEYESAMCAFEEEQENERRRCWLVCKRWLLLLRDAFYRLIMATGHWRLHKVNYESTRNVLPANGLLTREVFSF